MISSIHPSFLPSRSFLAVQVAGVIQVVGFDPRAGLRWLRQQGMLGAADDGSGVGLQQLRRFDAVGLGQRGGRGLHLRGDDGALLQCVLGWGRVGPLSWGGKLRGGRGGEWRGRGRRLSGRAGRNGDGDDGDGNGRSSGWRSGRGRRQRRNGRVTLLWTRLLHPSHVTGTYRLNAGDDLSSPLLGLLFEAQPLTKLILLCGKEERDKSKSE